MNTLFNKLAAYFLSMTATTKSKREVEWSVNDLNQIGLYLILLISIVLIMEVSAWFLILAVALVLGWNWVMRKTRTLVLSMLYPSNGNLDENGDPVDGNLEELMGQLDSAIKVLSDMK